MNQGAFWFGFAFGFGASAGVLAALLLGDLLRFIRNLKWPSGNNPEHIKNQRPLKPDASDASTFETGEKP